MRKVKIFCDNGLGNRLNSLIGGLIVSDILNATPIVYWPINNWCGCDITDLYENITFEIKHDKINDVFNDNINDIFLIRDNHSKINLKKIYELNINSLNEISNLKNDVIYYDTVSAPFCSIKKTIEKLKQLKINSDILNKVILFLNEKNINNKTLGILFRKTDLENDNYMKIDENLIENFIKNNKNLFFYITSDCVETEKKFSLYQNVLIYPKKSYVEKYINGSWDSLIIDDQFRISNFNVNRKKESVIEAFISLLILSRTNIIVNIPSTFLQYSKLYSIIDF
jgi:hypothetical protein